MRLQFGKHKGEHIANVPQDYLRWLLSLEDLEKTLRKAIRHHLSHFDGKRTPKPKSNKNFFRAHQHCAPEHKLEIESRRSLYLFAPDCPFSDWRSHPLEEGDPF